MSIDEFSQFLSDKLTEYRTILVLGDSTLYLDSEDIDGLVFSHVLDAMGLYANGFPTHKAGHQLDQIYTTLDNELVVVSCERGAMISTHSIIYAHTPLKSRSQRVVTSRMFKNNNNNNMQLLYSAFPGRS